MHARSFLAAVIAFLGLVLPVGHAQAANLLVVPDDYPTIQGAIDAAAPGDTIGVRKGVYPEDLWIEHYMTITGLEENRRDVVVQGRIDVYDFRAPSVVTLHNLTLRGDLLAHESADIQTGRLEIVGTMIIEEGARVSLRASNLLLDGPPIEVDGELYIVGARLDGDDHPVMIMNHGFMLMNYSRYINSGIVVLNNRGAIEHGMENIQQDVGALVFNECGVVSDGCGNRSTVTCD